MTPAGFPHSDIPGSTPACGSPRLFAASHVLLRFLMPRHPPCALSSLTTVSLRRYRGLRVEGQGSYNEPWLPRRFAISHKHFLCASSRLSRLFSFQRTRKSLKTEQQRGDGSVDVLDSPRGANQGLQKGGDPTAGSPTVTLLRLSPNQELRVRRLPPCGWHGDLAPPSLSWLDGRCVQGSGTHSPQCC